MRTFLYLFISLFFSFSSMAQGGFNFGIAAALNFSSASLGDISEIDIKTKSGLAIGVVPEIVINENFKIPLYLMFSMKGHKEELNGELQRSYSNHYLDFMPEFDAVLLGPIRGGLGLKLGYNLQEFIWIPGQTSERIDLLEPIDFGATANVKLAFNKWQLYARYELGLIGVNEIFFTDQDGNQTGQTDQINTNLQFGVSVFL